MDWNDLKYVLAVARSESFKRAARQMKVAHTTVGRRVQTLENALGVELFTRSTSGAQPTEYCLRLIDVASRMEAEFQSFRQDIVPPEEHPQGIVRINTAPWIISSILCPAIPRLRRSYPDIQMFFIGDVIESAKRPPGIGFTLRFDVLPNRNEIEIPLCDINFSAYEPVGAARDMPWVTTDFDSFTLQTRHWLRERHPDAKLVTAGSDASFVHALIVAGVGQGLIPEFLGERDARLRRVADNGPDLVRHYRALVPREIMPNPAFRAAFNWLKETLSDHFEVFKS